MNLTLRVLFSMLTSVLAGYLLGLTIGFTLFDPNTDLYALLGAALAILGAGIGLLRPVARRAHITFGALVGFYLAAVAAILLFGDARHDDLLEMLKRGGVGLILVVLATGLGAWLAARFLTPTHHLPAMGFLLGGFLGGYLFGVVFDLAPSSGLVGFAPFVIVSAGVSAFGLWWMQKRPSA